MTFRDIWLCLCASRHGEAAAVSRRARGSQKKKKLPGARADRRPPRVLAVRMRSDGAAHAPFAGSRRAKKRRGARARFSRGCSSRRPALPAGHQQTAQCLSLSQAESTKKKGGVHQNESDCFIFILDFCAASRSSSLADVCAPSPMFAPQMLESSRRRRQRGRKRNAIKLLIRGKNGRRGARGAGGRCRHCRAARQCAGERAGPAPPPTPSHPTPRPSLRGWTAAVAAAS